MQKALSYMKRAILDYHMIEPGDRIAIGLSGGKDSTLMMVGLAELRRFLGIPYTLHAITLDPGFEDMHLDFSAHAALAKQIDVPFTIKKTDIGHVVFDIRAEKNPCSLCARLRRGSLHDAAVELGCNKVALGHHRDDAIETFLMNLFQEGRVGCFSPVTYLSRKDITMIRPLLYMDEAEIRRIVNRLHFPIVQSCCPAEGLTERSRTKEFIAKRDKAERGFKKRLFGALKKSGVDGW